MHAHAGRLCKGQCLFVGHSSRGGRGTRQILHAGMPADVERVKTCCSQLQVQAVAAEPVILHCWQHPTSAAPNHISPLYALCPCQECGK